VLHLGGPPEFALAAEPDEDVCGRAGGRKRLYQFFQGLRDFAKATGFVEWFDGRKELHDGLVEEARASMTGVDVGMLEAWYGVKQRGYHIVLAPLFHPGGFGPRIPAADGKLDLYSVIGPQSAKAGRPGFGKPEDFRYLVWHEFSHSFVNPVVDRNGAAVDRFESLFEPLRKQMKKQAYANWRTCVYEHVVRAATIRFAFREDGPAAGKRALEHERGRGFAHVEALARELERYEKDRARWPAFGDFFGELLKVFERAAGEKPPEPAAQVVLTIPEAGNLKVDPGLAELRVEFDRDMNQSGFAWVQQSAETFPKTTGKPRWLTPRVCVLPVALEPGREYWVGINGGRFQGFRDLAGRPAEEHPIPFKTRR
jgi:hypothetical protein